MIGAFAPKLLTKPPALPESTFEYGNKSYPIAPCSSFSPLIYRTAGYLPIQGETTYVKLVKPRGWDYAALTVLLLCLVGILFFPWTEPSVPVLPAPDPDAILWKDKEPTYSSEKLVFDGITSMTVSVATRRAEVFLHNPKSNQSYCIVSLWVYLDGQWQECFQSGRIDPGKGLNQITLSRAIPTGSYSAYVKYKSFHLSATTPINEVVFHFPLTAK